MGAAAAPVDLLTGDNTVGGEGSSCAADRSSTESQPSSSGSVTSTNTEPLSEGTEDSDNAPVSTSPARQQRRQPEEQHEKKVVVNQAAVAEIYQVCRQTRGLLSTARDGYFGSLRVVRWLTFWDDLSMVYFGHSFVLVVVCLMQARVNGFVVASVVWHRSDACRVEMPQT